MVRFLQILVASMLVVFGASFGWLQPQDGPIGTAAAQGGTAPGSDAKPIEKPNMQEPKATPKKPPAKKAEKKPPAKKKAAPKGPDPS